MLAMLKKMRPKCSRSGTVVLLGQKPPPESTGRQGQAVLRRDLLRAQVLLRHG
jgi:hypothetical protein